RNSMTLENLRDLFEHELADLYDAEQQLVKTLPKMAKAAESEELREAIEHHVGQTEEHVTRLERVFSVIQSRPNSAKCKGMKGLIEEGSDVMKMKMSPHVRDAAIIGSAQRVEHYEIAAYGTARAYAESLGLDEAARLLKETLEEEKEANIKLNAVAKFVNSRAESESRPATKPRVRGAGA
ncbi:MAG: ferritin-like domain-containing protein, partial [Candidatus Acidiferrales bacterium]